MKSTNQSLKVVLDMLLKFDLPTFGNHLENFILSFDSLALDTNYSEANEKFIENESMSIIEQWLSIRRKALLKFKDFILSDLKEMQYYNCRSLKKVLNPDGLIKKYSHDKYFKNIESSTKLLLSYIDFNGNIYYAIAGSFKDSAMENLPKELIGHIFHYVDGDICL